MKRLAGSYNSQQSKVNFRRVKGLFLNPIQQSVAREWRTDKVDGGDCLRR